MEYNQLKASIAAVIKTNNRKEITGQLLQNVLFQMTNVIGENLQLAGFATPLTDPHEPDQNLFYITDQGGVYPHFDNLTVDDGLTFLMWKNGEWTSHTVGVVTQEWVDSHYVSIDFFRSLFRAYDSAELEILPNNNPEEALPTVVDNIKAMVGFWTEQYISALGQQTGGGGGGGATSLDELSDVFLTNPSLGQALVFTITPDHPEGIWVNQTIQAGTDMATVWAALAGNTTQQINISHLTDALADYATKTYVDQNFITVAYFDRLFRAYNGNTLVSHNDVTSTIDNIKAMFGFWTEQYLSALGNNSGGGGQLLALSNMADVTLTTPIADKQVLTFDAVTQKWINANAQAGATALANLTDVTLTSLQNGQTLLYDSTTSKWYNSALKTINGQSLLGSGDISVGGGASGNYLPLSGGTLTGPVNMSFFTNLCYTFADSVNHGSFGYYSPLDIMYFDHRPAHIQIRISGNGNVSINDIGSTGEPEIFTFSKGGNILFGKDLPLNSSPVYVCTFNNNTSHDGLSYTSISSLDLDYLPIGGLSNKNAGNITWGVLSTSNGYTTVFQWITPGNGGYGFAYYNGQASMQVDGFFYQNEGQYRVYDVSGGTINGSVYATGAVTALSDIRRKDIQDFDIGLTVEKVAEAPTIRFLWKDKKDDGMQVGSIAQFWKSALPEVVRTEDDGNLSLQYGVAALVSAIVTARKVVDHERRITELEKENERLRTEVEQLRLN